jgi:hypothetical protein
VDLYLLLKWAFSQLLTLQDYNMSLQIENTNYSEIYPLAFPVMEMNTVDSIGTYSMANSRDYSGLGNNLVTTGAFNSLGMICTPTGSSANMPIAETAQLSFVMALNIPANPSGGAANILSTITPASAPFTGLRLTQSVSGSGSILVASGVTSPSSTTLDMGGITGGWTVFAVSISATKIEYVRGSGTTNSTAITPSRSVSTNKIVINGAPAGSQITNGVTGTIGALVLYNKALSVAEMTQQINNMRVFMATKGVTIP